MRLIKRPHLFKILIFLTIIFIFLFRQNFFFSFNILLTKGFFFFCISWDNRLPQWVSVPQLSLPIYKIVSLNRSSYAFSVLGKERRIPEETERGVYSRASLPCPPEELCTLATSQHWEGAALRSVGTFIASFSYPCLLAFHSINRCRIKSGRAHEKFNNTAQPQSHRDKVTFYCQLQ